MELWLPVTGCRLSTEIRYITACHILHHNPYRFLYHVILDDMLYHLTIMFNMSCYILCVVLYMLCHTSFHISCTVVCLLILDYVTPHHISYVKVSRYSEAGLWGLINTNQWTRSASDARQCLYENVTILSIYCVFNYSVYVFMILM